ncbi:MAG: translation initiation factor IF-6 [Candidatus Thermoplasmatota archaeon]
MLQLLDFNENPNIGVYCRTNESVVFLEKNLNIKIKKLIESTLSVKVVELCIANASIIGSLLVFNSSGAVVTDFADEYTIKKIEEQKLDVYVIKDVINAAGNDILVNDNGALVHPGLKDETIKMIAETLDVPAMRGTIAELPTVGMAAVVTNKGCLCHPKVTAEEKRVLEDIFDVEIMTGTVNHGFPMIGTGLVANTKGALIGNQTTGIEMNRIEEALGFI